MREFAHQTGHFTDVCCAACATMFRLAVEEYGRAVGDGRRRKVLRFPDSRRAS
jgi:hypothetical protein